METKSTVNFGLAILKLLACFAVVGIHEGFGIRGNTYAVPVFMTVAFYLSGKAILFGDFRILMKRILKIMIPLWFWSVFGFCFFLAFRIRNVGVSDLLYQVIFGHSFIKPLWFLPVLAVITVIIWLIGKVAGKSNLAFYCILGVLFIFSLGVQFSSLFRAIKSLPEEISWPLGRLFEMFPCAVGGMILAARIPLFPRLDKKKAFYAGSCIVLAVIVHKILPQLDGFGYGGLLHPALAANVTYLALLVGSALAVKYGNECKFIVRLPSGIYYSHYLIGCLLPMSGCLVKTIMVFVIGAGVSAIMGNCRLVRATVA